ncbi:unnamed protein product [Trichobilharzia szidati]|nr:unnamed protein product [Trichobilharzia szidati]
MKYKFTLLTPWTLLPTSLPDNDCEDKEATLFCKLLSERVENQYGREVFWPTGRGEAFLQNSFNSFENRFLKYSQYALLIVSGENASCLDHIYPRFLVFFTAKQSWADRIIIVFLKKPTYSFIFDTSLLKHPPIVFNGDSSDQWNNDKEAWSQIIQLIEQEYTPDSAETYQKYLFTPTDYYFGGWMSVTDLRGQPLAVRITSSSSQTESILSSWNDLHCSELTNRSDHSPCMKQYSSSNPIGQRLSQSVADFKHSPTQSHGDSSRSHSHVNISKRNRNKSLSPKRLSKSCQDHNNTFCGIKHSYSHSFGRHTCKFINYTEVKCQIDDASHYETTLLESRKHVKTHLTFDANQMCVPRKKLKFRSCEFLDDVKPSWKIFQSNKSPNVHDGSEYSSSAVTPDLPIKKHHLRSKGLIRRRYHLCDESNLSTRKLIKLFKFRRKKEVHFGNSSKFELAKAVKTLSDVGQSLAEGSVGTIRYLEKPEDIDVIEQPSCSYETSVSSVHTRTEQHIDLKINYNYIGFEQHVKDVRDENSQVTPIPSADYSDSGQWSMSQTTGEDTTNNSAQHILSGSESPLFDFIDNQHQFGETPLQNAVTSSIRPCDLGEEIKLSPQLPKDQTPTQMILVMGSYSPANDCVSGSSERSYTNEQTGVRTKSMSDSYAEDNDSEVTLESVPMGNTLMKESLMTPNLSNHSYQIPSPNSKSFSVVSGENKDTLYSSQLSESINTFSPQNSPFHLYSSQGKNEEYSENVNKTFTEGIDCGLSHLSTFKPNSSVSSAFHKDFPDEEVSKSTKDCYPSEAEMCRVATSHSERKSKDPPTCDSSHQSLEKQLSSSPGKIPISVVLHSEVPTSSCTKDVTKFDQGSTYNVTVTKVETSEVRSLLLTDSTKPQDHSPSEAEDMSRMVSELADVNANLLPGGNIQTSENSHHPNDIHMHSDFDTNEKVAFNNDFNTQNLVNTTVPSRPASHSASTNVPDSDNSDAPVNKTDVNNPVNETLDGSVEHSGDHMKSSVTYIRINSVFKMSENHPESETTVSSSAVTIARDITELPASQFHTFAENKTVDSLTANHKINEGETSTCNQLVDSSDNLPHDLPTSNQQDKINEIQVSSYTEPEPVSQEIFKNTIPPSETCNIKTIRLPMELGDSTCELSEGNEISRNNKEGLEKDSVSQLQPNETSEHLPSGLHEDKTIGPSLNYPSGIKDYQSDDISTMNRVTDQCGLDTSTEGKDTPDQSIKNHIFSDQQTEVNAFQSLPFSQTGDYNIDAHNNSDAVTVDKDDSLNAQSLSQSKVESLTDPDIVDNRKQSNTECVNVFISGEEQSVDSGTNQFNIMRSFLPKQTEAAESTVILTNLVPKEELENDHSSAVSEISSQQPLTYNKPFPDQNSTDDHTESNASMFSSLKTHDYQSPEEDALGKQICHNTDEMASSSGDQIAIKNVEDVFIKPSGNLHFVSFDSCKNAETTVKPQQAIEDSTAANSSSIVSPITVDPSQYSVALINIPVNKDDVFENVPLVSEISPLISRLEQSATLMASVPHTSYFPVINPSEFEDKDLTNKPGILLEEKAYSDRADNQKTLGHESPTKSGEAVSEIHTLTSYDKEASDRENSVDLCQVTPVKICALYATNDGRPQENVNNDSGTLLSYQAKPSSPTDENNTTVDSDNSDNIVTDFKGSQSTPPLSWDSERSDYSNMTYSPTVYLCNSETSLQVSSSIINSSSQLENDMSMTDNTACWLNHSLNGVEFVITSSSSPTAEKAVADEEDSSSCTMNQIYVDDKYILQLPQHSRIGDLSRILKLMKMLMEVSVTDVSFSLDTLTTSSPHSFIWQHCMFQDMSTGCMVQHLHQGNNYIR